MSSCAQGHGHGPEWQGQILRGNFDCLPQPPHCTAHHLPLGSCDECGTTSRLGAWAEGMSNEDLRVALFSLLHGGRHYRSPERDAVIREAMRRLPR